MLTKEQIQQKYGLEYNTILNPRADLYVKYTQEGLRGSAELNMALIEYFYSGLPFYNDNLRIKAFEINNGFFKDGEIFKNNKKLTVYHGTNYNLHDPKNNFTTYAFFSTTIAPEIAETYGKIIYKIIIPKEYPIINLYDQSNMQILLPIGTKVNNINPYSTTCNKVTYECNIDTSNIEQIITTIYQLLKPEIKPIDININTNNFLEEIQDISLFNSVNENNKFKGYSKNNSCYFNNNVSYGKVVKKKILQSKHNYIIKDIIKKKDFHKCFKKEDYICRRIMNEILASLVYQAYGLKTFDYDLVYNDKYKEKPKYMLGSKIINNIDYKLYNLDSSKSDELLKGFIVDCILSNWDAYNNNNIGLLNNESIRTDVGGALAYRGIGDFKLSFFNNLKPNEHIIFIRENPNIQKILIRNIQDYKIRNIEYYNFMFTILKPIDEITGIIEKIKENPKIAIFMPYYENFIDKILNTIINRHNYYANKQNQPIIIKEITDTLKYFTQSGGSGGSKGSKQLIIYQGKVRKVYTTNKMRYIILNKTKVSLKEIKGKYKYQKQLGGGPEECPIFENVPGNDLDSTGTQEKLEEKLAELLKNLKLKTNSNARA